VPLDTKTEPNPVVFVVTTIVPAVNVVALLFANAVVTDLMFTPLFNCISELVGFKIIRVLNYFHVTNYKNNFFMTGTR
jgi:hypothetical protein